MAEKRIFNPDVLDRAFRVLEHRYQKNPVSVANSLVTLFNRAEVETKRLYDEAVRLGVANWSAMSYMKWLKHAEVDDDGVLVHSEDREKLIAFRHMHSAISNLEQSRPTVESAKSGYQVSRDEMMDAYVKLWHITDITDADLECDFFG